jgi:hypothetical protein
VDLCLERLTAAWTLGHTCGILWRCVICVHEFRIVDANGLYVMNKLHVLNLLVDIELFEVSPERVEVERVP